MRGPADKSASPVQALQQSATRLTWAAGAIAVAGLVLMAGLFSPAARAQLAAGAALAGTVPARLTSGNSTKVLAGPGPDSVARANAVHQRALAQHEALIAEFNITLHDKDKWLLDVWDILGPTAPCVERERFGEMYEGGKWVCSPYEILSPEPCFVFSLGCNGISGFEEDVKARYPHCVIHIYDPTTSERTAKEVMARTQGTLHRKWITSEADLDSNHTYPNTTRARDYSHEWTTLAREMQAHGASWINILKVDIEGSEWDLFDEFFADGRALPFTEILVELHVPKLEKGAAINWGTDTPTRLQYFFSQLTRNGYRVTNSELNLRCGRNFGTHCLNFIEYSLVKMDDDGNVMHGPL